MVRFQPQLIGNSEEFTCVAGRARLSISRDAPEETQIQGALNHDYLFATPRILIRGPLPEDSRSGENAVRTLIT
jgi:hypothetical protein